MRTIDELLKVLRDIHASNQEISAAVRAYTETYKSTQTPQQSSSGARSPLQLPEAITGYYESEQKERPHNNRWKVFERVFIALTFGVAVLGAGFTYCTLLQVIHQVDAARSQLKFSVESFRSDERAWIEFEPVKPELFTPRDSAFGASFIYKLYLKNVGKTAAHDIHLRIPREGAMASRSFGQDAKGISWDQDKLLLGQVPSATEIPIENPTEKTLAPSATSTVFTILHGQEPNKGMIYYFVDRIDYMDTFNVRHWKKFCFFVANQRGDLWNCLQGNEEDRNPESAR